MKTVLITGATSGLGKNLTEYLAQTSEFKPVIVARNEEKLKQAIIEYIDFYNNKRFQANLKGMTPVEFGNHANPVKCQD